MVCFCSVLPKLPLHQRPSGPPRTQPFFDLIKTTGRGAAVRDPLSCLPHPFLSFHHWASVSLPFTGGGELSQGSPSPSSAHSHQVTSAAWRCLQPAVSFLLMLTFLFHSSLMLSSPPTYLLLLLNTLLLIYPLPPTIWCFTCSFSFLLIQPPLVFFHQHFYIFLM